MMTVEEGGAMTGFSAGYTTFLRVPPSETMLGVRVLDALSSRKSHQVEPGDDAYVIFLLIHHPNTPYDALRTGTRFEIVENDTVVGTGTVHARVD